MLIFLKWEEYESQKQILSFDYDGNVTLKKKKKQFKNSYLSKYFCSHYETIF